jgi:hypothetical protein
MPRFTRTLSLLLTLSLFLASCLTPHVTPSPTPTKIPQPPLETFLTKDTQTALTQQGWKIAWDAKKGQYTLSQLTHEIGFIDAEGRLHFTAAQYSATENPDGTWKDASTTSNIVVDLKSLPQNPDLTIRQTDENGAPLDFAQVKNELAKPGFHTLETKNPAFKNGILSFTYLDENGAVQTVTFNRNLETAISTHITSIAENDAVFEGTPTLIPWQAIHSDAPLTAQLAILNGYDRPVEEKLRSTFEGWKLRFEAYPGLRKANSDPLPSAVFLTYAPLYIDGTNAYTYDQLPMRYTFDENGNLPLFQTITPDGKRLIMTLKQLYNPQNITDKKNRPADETLIIPATFGELTDEQLKKLPDSFNNGLYYEPDPDHHTIIPMRTSSFPTIVLADQGNLFKLIAEDPDKAYQIAIKQMKDTENVFSLDYLAVAQEYFSRASLDSLLGREGNDVKGIPFRAYGKIYHFSDLFQEGFSGAQNSPQKIYERPYADDNPDGTDRYLSLSSEIQTVVFVISP